MQLEGSHEIYSYCLRFTNNSRKTITGFFGDITLYDDFGKYLGIIEFQIDYSTRYYRTRGSDGETVALSDQDTFILMKSIVSRTSNPRYAILSGETFKRSSSNYPDPSPLSSLKIKYSIKAITFKDGTILKKVNSVKI